MEPSWQPDPTGRHDYRWWDGVGWSDQVGDRGRVTIDDRPVPSRTARPAGPGGRSGSPVVVRRSVVVLGMVAVVALVGAALLAFRTQAPPRVEVTEVKLTATSAITKLVHVKAGEAMRIRLEPSGRLDTRAVVLAPQVLAERTAQVMAADLSDYFVSDDPAGLLAASFPLASGSFLTGDAHGKFDAFRVIRTIDAGASEEHDAGSFVALVEGDYTIVLTSMQDTAGSARVVFERNPARFEPKLDDYGKFIEGEFFTDPAFYTSNDPYVPSG